MSDGPAVSVVVPMFNAEATVGSQLEALLRQGSRWSFEVVVADNGSTDGSRRLVEAISSRDPRVRLIDARAHLGPASARNAGAARASGRLLLFCDADDLVAPGWIDAMGSALGHAPAVAGPLELARLNEAWLQHAYGSKLATEPQSFLGIFPFGASANFGLQRSVFESLGGFDPSIDVGEDIELCLRLWEAGHSLVFDPDAIVHYRLRGSSRALWRQAVRYGAATPLIVSRLLRSGHAVAGRTRGLRKWLWLGKALPSLGTRQGRARWLVVLGGCVGRVAGSLRHRTLYL